MSLCSDLSHYFAEPATACAVCMAEGGQANSHNYNPPIEDSVGPFQVNLLAHPDYDRSRAFDADYNAQYAARLQAAQGWGPWSTYTSGKYRDYLGQCGGSASPVLSGLPTGWVAWALLGLGALWVVENA